METPGNKEENTISDEAVMQLVVNGDRDAFVKLVRKYQGALLNFFHRMNVYSGDGDDLAQETFIRLFNYREKYRPTARFTTFLYLMARQVQIDYYRKQKRRATLTEALKNEHTPVDARLDAGTIADAKERTDKALNTLSEEMRVVVVMSIYQELKYREISEILEIPLGTVKTRMFHALQKLREAMKNEQ